jgi:2-phosphoglycerate kinase
MERRRSELVPLGDPDGIPYSKGLMARALLLAGVPAEPAYLIAGRLELELGAEGGRAVSLARVEQLAYEVLGGVEGAAAVSRLRRQAALQELDAPIVVLLGGATGTGKSTVATEVAHRLGITRVTSTDFIRQTLRAYFPPSEMPIVHRSSFEAGELVGDTEAGFIEQTRRVLVGVEAAIERALAEGWSMVIEGAHLVPGLIPTEIEGALVVPAVLRLSSVELHRQRFYVRDAATGGVRAMSKYLGALDRIRLLQEVVVARAERDGVPVIESSDLERATAELLDCVLAASERLGAPRSGV